jgi:hypothetical protein
VYTAKITKGDKMSELVIYSTGLFCMSVCAPKDMSQEDVEVAANLASGTNRWKISDDECFAQGGKIPVQCEQNENRQHWLLNI